MTSVLSTLRRYAKLQLEPGSMTLAEQADACLHGLRKAEALRDKLGMEAGSTLDEVMEHAVATLAIETPLGVTCTVMAASVDKAIGAQPVISPKSDETKTMLKAAIDKCLLFDTMTEAQRNVVIDVMVAVNVAKGDAVIKQGDELSGGSGDNFYVVGEGTFDIHRVREGETTPELVQQRAAGDIFGELALMYNVPRQATVTCTSDGALLWALRRQTFQEIQHSQALDSIHTLNETLQAIEKIRHQVYAVELKQYAASPTGRLDEPGKYFVVAYDDANEIAGYVSITAPPNKPRLSKQVDPADYAACVESLGPDASIYEIRSLTLLSAWRGWRPLAKDPHAPPDAPVSRDHLISTNPGWG